MRRALGGGGSSRGEDHLDDAGGGQWAGESSRCEDPAPTVGIAGRPWRGITPGYHKASANGKA